jgi:hypothetical protein
MKTNSIQQEILLITGTDFSSRQYASKDNTDNSKNIPENERLKEACWNGLLKEMLPEIFQHGAPADKLFLWQMREAMHFFSLEMGEGPTDIDFFFSIDPYCFMCTQDYN